MGCTTSRASSVSSNASSSTSSRNNANFNTTDATNTTFQYRTYNPTNTYNRIKNIALEESTKSITALAHFIGPNDAAVQKILGYYQHPINEKCTSCQEGKSTTTDKICIQHPKDESSNNNEKSTIMDEALSTIECSICLDTFTQPITLPCGHSLCASHHTEIDSKCPFCRKPFSNTLQKSELIDKDLAQNIDVVLQLANVLDADRDTVRDAIKNVNMSKCVIPSGTIVSLQGLVNATERNGMRGVIKTYNAEAGRYAVLLDGCHSSNHNYYDKTVSVRPTKLLQHARVCINGVQSKPELNGQYGQIIGWCGDKGRYNVELLAATSQKTISLQPKNVVLESGTVVRFVNLVNKAEMNGTWGTIQEFVESGKKYDVQLTTQRTIRINMENVRV